MAQVKGGPMLPTDEMLKAIKERAEKVLDSIGGILLKPETRESASLKIAAFAQTERETAERETLEACAKQMCLKCGAGQKVERRLSGNWYHNDFVCFAGPIHALARGKGGTNGCD